MNRLNIYVVVNIKEITHEFCLIMEIIMISVSFVIITLIIAFIIFLITIAVYYNAIKKNYYNDEIIKNVFENIEDDNEEKIKEIDIKIICK